MPEDKWIGRVITASHRRLVVRYSFDGEVEIELGDLLLQITPGELDHLTDTLIEACAARIPVATSREG